jgi:hypothetical protein
MKDVLTSEQRLQGTLNSKLQLEQQLQGTKTSKLQLLGALTSEQ